MTRRRNGATGAVQPPADAGYVAARRGDDVNRVYAVALGLHREIRRSASADTTLRLGHQLALLNEAIHQMQAVAMGSVARRGIADDVGTRRGVVD